MTHLKRAVVVALVGLGLSAGFVGSAHGAAGISTFHFYDCTGPDGTPSSFDAVKTALPDAALNPVSASLAFRLSGGGVFVVLQFGDSYIAPGVPVTGLVTTTCTVDVISDGQPLTTTFSGFIT